MSVLVGGNCHILVNIMILTHQFTYVYKHYGTAVTEVIQTNNIYETALTGGHNHALYQS